MNVSKVCEYLLSLDDALERSKFEYWVTEHLRVSGAYWMLAALDVLGRLDCIGAEKQLEIKSWVIECQHKSSGFGGNRGHDAHLLYTLSAVQIACMFDFLHEIDIEGVVQFVSSLQREDGSFAGDEWGEIDTRFSYCAISTLRLLDRLDAIDVKAAIGFIHSCRNFDGAFGALPNAESHAGQTFCCVAALALVDALHPKPPINDGTDNDSNKNENNNKVEEAKSMAKSTSLEEGDDGDDDDEALNNRLAWWLAERQVQGGGLNGRPEKLPDVCYSWWVLSSLSLLHRLDWIDAEALIGFILQCQDAETGGFADRPGDVPDVYHTFFALCGLSFLNSQRFGLKSIDAAFALTTHALEDHRNRQNVVKQALSDLKWREHVKIAAYFARKNASEPISDDEAWRRGEQELIARGFKRVDD